MELHISNWKRLPRFDFKIIRDFEWIPLENQRRSAKFFAKMLLVHMLDLGRSWWNFFGRFQVGVSKNSGAPKWMVYNENPIKMDDLGVPLFSETSRWMLNMWPVGFGFSDLVLDFRLIRKFIQCLGPWKCHTTTHQLHLSILNELLRIRIL